MDRRFRRITRTAVPEAGPNDYAERSHAGRTIFLPCVVSPDRAEGLLAGADHVLKIAAGLQPLDPAVDEKSGKFGIGAEAGADKLPRRPGFRGYRLHRLHDLRMRRLAEPSHRTRQILRT